MKLKTLLDLLQLPPDDYNGLCANHQTLKATVKWLVSMGYNAAIKSTESVTKAVVTFPSIWEASSIETLKEMYNETKYNLQVFARWLGSKLAEIYNPKKET